MRKYIILGFLFLFFFFSGCVYQGEKTEEDFQAVQNNYYKEDKALISRDAVFYKADFIIEGMFCASCSTGIEYALKEKKGVKNAGVSYKTKRGWVVYNPEIILLEDLIKVGEPYILKPISNQILTTIP